MSEELALGAIPSTTGWIAVVQDNFDDIESFVNRVASMVCHEDDIVIHHDEIIIY